MSALSLTPTSYLVLGLLQQHGGGTSYDLERWVGRSVGYFWAFPRAQLYKEPARLAGGGLLDEVREQGGRRRRLFTVTQAGAEALRGWLADPAGDHTEIRDIGLLKLFFRDAAEPGDVARLARTRLRSHQERLAVYEQLAGPGHPPPGAGGAAALRMGVLVERACVAFWDEMLSVDLPVVEGPDAAASTGP